MLNETEVDRLWEDYDPFQEHDVMSEFCGACFTATRTCHKCGGISHNQLITADDITMAEWLCEDCGHYYTEEMERLG